MELIKFIFQGFWHFVGFVILLAIVGAILFDGISDVIKAIKCKKDEDK